ncbi:hemolysin family protein [Alkalihalobacillus sp. 1P02AB]|uniref:hemolysin family protein n=1 Tax=Alkalihalobacillus sp. 1P02AB TaxID=3132260 RepID=UPI0039A5835D
MDDVPLSMILIFSLLLVLSTFFSFVETAYANANRIRLKQYEEEGRLGAKRAVYIADHIEKALSTSFIGFNLVNIAAAAIAAQIAIQIYDQGTGVFISAFAVTILVLLFAGVIPKTIAKQYAETLAMKFSFLLHLFMMVLTPVTWVFMKIQKGFSKFMKVKEVSPSVTEEEIKAIIDISEEEGVIDKREKELVNRSLDFNDIVVSEILRPRPDMVAIEINQPIHEIKDIFFEERYSRIPVYEGSIDNIIGILSERDFLTALIQQGEHQVKIRTLLRNPLFVVQSMKVSTLLPELQKQKVHMAIVIDEFGGTSGLITLEDLLEEIVGEIWDEHDESIRMVKQLDASNYIFFGDYSVDEFANFLQVGIPETSQNTIGGWLTEVFTRVPNVGEEYPYENLLLKVTEAEERRIRQVEVTVVERTLSTG